MQTQLQIPIRSLAVVAIAAAAAWPGSAAAFRCGNDLVSIGDREFQVEEACGPPVAIKPLGHGHHHHDHHGGEEIWYYDLGRNRLLRILHFRNGRLRRVETESRPDVLGRESGDCRPTAIIDGMTALELLRRCGQPDQRERHHRLQPLGHGHHLDHGVATHGHVRVLVEEWYYGFGDRYLDRVIRLVDGRVTDVDTVD